MTIYCVVQWRDILFAHLVVRWFYGIPSDVYKGLETSSLKVVKGSQGILKGVAYVGKSANKHRFSLGIALRMYRKRLLAYQKKLRAKVSLPDDTILESLRSLFAQPAEISDGEDHLKCE